MDSIVTNKADQKQINGLIGSALPQNCTLGDLVAHRAIAIKGNYKFSRDGGAIGNVTLKDELGNPITLPVGLIVYGGLCVVKTGLTSGGTPTFDIGVDGSAALFADKALTAVDTANEISALIPVATAATAALITTAGAFTLEIKTATVTAGELDVYLMCFYRE